MAQEPSRSAGSVWFWWLRHIVFILVGCFFTVFGIGILASAYEADDPHTFIYTFFAANFIILFSLTLIVVFIFRIKAFARRAQAPPAEGNNEPPTE